mgnify:CR=1 FL=1
MKQEFKIISDFIEKNTRVLDVGCGDGTLMEYGWVMDGICIAYRRNMD